MDVLIVLGIAVVAFVLLLAHIARNRGRVFSSGQFTSQALMHNFASEDRKHAIEEVQFVKEDEVQEADGTRKVPVRGQGEATTRTKEI